MHFNLSIVQGRIIPKELIETMVMALVDDPEQVKVLVIDGGMTWIIELRVAKADPGKVIGRQGRKADAMAKIVSAASMKIRKRVKNKEAYSPDSKFSKN